jgi:hypothetical protein
MKQTITAICVALSFAIWMSLAGCYAWNSASTEATYEITKDGKFIKYKSNKEQQGLDLTLQEQNGQIQAVVIHVDKSGTLESLANGLVQQQQRLYDAINQLVQTFAPIAAAAAKAGS